VAGRIGSLGFDGTGSFRRRVSSSTAKIQEVRDLSRWESLWDFCGSVFVRFMIESSFWGSVNRSVEYIAKVDGSAPVGRWICHDQVPVGSMGWGPMAAVLVGAGAAPFFTTVDESTFVTNAAICEGLDALQL